VALGGDANTPYTLAGLGDLVTTATSRSSHHHELGVAIGEGHSVELKGEGIHSLQMVQKFQPFSYTNFPLFALCCDIINNTEKSRDYFDAYLKSFTEQF